MTTRIRRFGAYRAAIGRVPCGATTVSLWQVDDLEAHVDRAALLAGENPPEPPYWAHLWSGSRVLATALPSGTGRAVEIGCGLGLPGLAAALRGWRTTFVDRAAEPLAFVRASAALNGLAAPACVVADVTTPALRGRFDLVLAAELLYDRAAFPAMADALARLVAPGGACWIADAARIDTRAFWPLLAARGLVGPVEVHRVDEEGFPVTVRLAQLRRAADDQRS